MKKIKIPNHKELGINLKNLLWFHKPKSFNEWKIIAEKDFVIKLKKHLKEREELPLFSDLYQIMFYHGFINFRKELMLKEFLEIKGFSVEIPKLIYDSIWQIDLIASKANKKLFIQLKSNLNISEAEVLKLKTFALNRNGIPVLAVKSKTHYELINLINSDKKIISMYNIRDKKHI